MLYRSGLICLYDHQILSKLVWTQSSILCTCICTICTWSNDKSTIMSSSQDLIQLIIKLLKLYVRKPQLAPYWIEEEIHFEAECILIKLPLQYNSKCKLVQDTKTSSCTATPLTPAYQICCLSSPRLAPMLSISLQIYSGQRAHIGDCKVGTCKMISTWISQQIARANCELLKTWSLLEYSSLK